MEAFENNVKYFYEQKPLSDSHSFDYLSNLNNDNKNYDSFSKSKRYFTNQRDFSFDSVKFKNFDM